MAAASPSFLSRDQLTGMKNVLIFDLANRDFVLGTRKRRYGVATIGVPILLLVLCMLIAGCPTLAAIGITGVGQGNQVVVFWLVAVVLAAFFLVGIVISYRRYRLDKRFDTQGKLLQVTITEVKARERAEVVKKAMTVAAVIEFILDLLDFSSSSLNRASDGVSGYESDDFYEITIAYSATTPSGSQISGTAKADRPDLRGKLPYEGDPMIVLYLDDQHFKLM